MKKTRTRFLSILLTLCMVLTLLPMTAFAAGNPDASVVNVNGHAFNTTKLYYTNGAADTGNDSTNYNAHYDPDTGILTLKNYTGGSVTIGGALKTDITIKLIGSNSITTASNGGIVNSNGGNITITADSAATLEISVSNSKTACGICASIAAYSTGSVVLNGYADITVNATTTGSYEYAYGIQGRVNVSINDNASFKATCIGNNNGYGYGIYGTSGVTINTNGSIDINMNGCKGPTDVVCIGATSAHTLTKVGNMTLRYPTGVSSISPATSQFSATTHAINKDSTTHVESYRYGTPYTVTVENGTAAVCDSLNKVSAQFLQGDTVSITAGTVSGLTFKNWTSADVTVASGTNATTTFAMPSKAVTVMANYNLFTTAPSFARTGTGKGTISFTLAATPAAAPELVEDDSDTVVGSKYFYGSELSRSETVTEGTGTYQVPAGDYRIAVQYGTTWFYSDVFTVNYTAPSVPAASVGNVTISGTKDSAITSTDVTVTLQNDTFATTLSGNWITNLPAGLSQSVSKTSDTTAKITVSGTPTATSTAALAITIPNAQLVTSTTDLTATANASAKYNITAASATYAVTVTGGTGGGNYAAGATVTITAGAPASGKQFKEWTGADSLIFTDSTSTTSPTAKFTMPAGAVSVTATYEDIPATPTITSVSVSPSAPTVQRDTQQQFTATVNGTGAYNNAVTWSITGGDSGTNISSTGLLSITLYNAADTITVTATSVADSTKYGTATVTLTNAPVALTFTDSASYDIPAAIVDAAISNINVAGGASGGTTPYTFTASGLPAGLSISAAGVISGTPTTAGAAGTATITVTDSATPTPATANITIAYGAISPAAPTTYTISVTSGAPDKATAAAGETVTITASPAASGQQFKEWTGADSLIFTDSTSKTSSTAKFTMPAGAVSVTATYENIPATPTITSVSVSPSAPTVQRDTQQQFTATVNGTGAYNNAVTWSITGGTFGTAISNSGMLSVSSANTADTITVTATSVADSTKYGTATVTLTNAPVALTFTDSASYDIPASTVDAAISNINVAGGASGGTTPYTFTASSLPAGLTISTAGVISGTPTTAGAAGTATITVTDSATPTSATANITIAYGAISPAAPGALGGSVNIGATDKTTAAAGETVTITASPAASGQQFKEWTGADSLTFTNSTSKTSSPAKFTMPAGAVSVTATYENIPAATYTVTYDANGGTGSMTSGSATDGVPFTLSANGFTPPAGKQFKEWAIGSTSGTKVAAGGTHTFTAAATVYAIWEDIPVSITSVSVTPATASVQKGTDRQFTATVSGTGAYNNAVSWAVIGAEKAGTTIDSSGKVTVDATETATTLTITASAKGDSSKTGTATVTVTSAPVTTHTVTVNGSYASTTGAGSYAKDATVSIYAGNRSNYSFNGWTVESGGVTITNPGSKNATFTMPNNAVTVKANWSYNGGGGSSGGSSTTYYTITTAAGTGGSFSTGKTVSVKAGDSAGFTITPDKGYAIADVKVDGKSVGAVSTYNFTNVRANHTISATFKVSGHTNPQTGVEFDFDDVKETDWFYEDAVYVFVNSLMNGTGTKTFSPNANTTRGMIVTILYRLAGEPEVTNAASFTDVSGDKYYADAIAWAYENKIVSGYSAESFGPDDAITREQMATILMNYAKLMGYDVTAAADLSAFSDAGNISGYAKLAMQWANAEGLVSGKGNGILDPGGNATRAQVAAILHRFCENIVK